MTLVLGDAKIVQTSLHAQGGSPAYMARAVFEVLETTTEIVQAVIGGAYVNPAPGAIWRQSPGSAWAYQADVTGYRGISTLLLTDENKIVAGMDTPAGVWISQDNGLSWTVVQSIGDSSYVMSMALLDTGTLLLGTGSDCEVWRSEDGGFSWTYIRALGSGAGTFNYVHGIVQAANGDIIAAVGDGNNAVDLEIWRSVTDGVTWTHLSTVANTDFFYGMFAHASGNLFAGQYNTGSDGKFYRSTDNGLTWASVGNCPNNDNPQCFVTLDNGYILAGTWGGAGQAEIWRSVNDGASWSYLSDVGAQVVCRALVLGHNDDVFAAVSDAVGGTANVYRSTDDGVSWELNAPVTGYNRLDCMLRLGE